MSAHAGVIDRLPPIASNVAAGTSRSSDRDFLRFVEVACGSLMEVVSQANIDRNQKLVDESKFKQIYDAAEELAKRLSALRNTLLGPN